MKLQCPLPPQTLPFLYLFILNWAEPSTHQCLQFLNLCPQTTAIWLCLHPITQAATQSSSCPTCCQIQNHFSVLCASDITASHATTTEQFLLGLYFSSGFGRGMLSALLVLLMILSLSLRLVPFSACSLQYRLSSFHFILFSQSIASNPMLSTATCKLMILHFYLLRPLWWLPETFIHPTAWDFCIWIYKGTSTNSTY